MEKKNIDWANLGFAYRPTDYRYVSMWKDGAWDEGTLSTEPDITMSECAGVLQYSQSVFEGLKAYTTEDGRIVTFRPDLNAERMEESAARIEIPPFPKERSSTFTLLWIPPKRLGATSMTSSLLTTTISVWLWLMYQARVFLLRCL